MKPHPGRGIPGDRRSSFAQSFFQHGDEDDVGMMDDSVPVPKARPMGRQMSRRNLSVVKQRPSLMVPHRGVEATRSGDSLNSAAASIASRNSRGSIRSINSPMVAAAAAASAAAAAGPARNAEDSWLRQSMIRASGQFDMNAIHAVQAQLKEEDDIIEEGFDDEEVLEQYRIMAQHEATLRVKANIGFDMADYEKRRKTSGNENKDKKDMYGGGKKPKLGLPPPQVVIGSNSNAGELTVSIPPPMPLSLINQQREQSVARQTFLLDQQRGEAMVRELVLGEKAQLNQCREDEHIVRCWGCRSCNIKVNFSTTLVRCPECSTVSQARKKN